MEFEARADTDHDLYQPKYIWCNFIFDCCVHLHTSEDLSMHWGGEFKEKYNNALQEYQEYRMVI